MTPLLPELRDQLVHAGQLPQAHGSPRGIRRRTFVAALAATLALGGAALAATTWLPVGTTVPADVVEGRGEPEFKNGRTVAATGDSPRVGLWRIYHSETDRGMCIGFEYVGTGQIAEGCGLSGAMTAAKWSIPHKEIAVYGKVPADTSRVEVELRGGGAVEAEVHRGPTGTAGNFYFAGLAYEQRPARVWTVDSDGRRERVKDIG